MDVQTMKVTRAEARDLYRKYKEHLHWSTPVDDQIRRTYQLIAQGRVVIQAIESIKLAGVDEAGLPKLALCRADAKTCYLRLERDGGGWMSMDSYAQSNHKRRHIALPAGTFPSRADLLWQAKAMVPPCPIHLRPKRGLANYHVLWEAEWTHVVPVDPMLLRRIGGDLWVVVAAWDLTNVERAVLSQRLSG